MINTTCIPTPIQGDILTKAVRKRTRKTSVTCIRKRTRKSAASYTKKDNLDVSTSGLTEGDGDETHKEHSFPLPLKVTSSDCLHDHIEILTSHGYILGNAGSDEEDRLDINRFRFVLGAPPKALRKGVESELHGTLLNTAPFKGKGSKALCFRKTSITCNGKEIQAPLLGGQIIMYRKKSGNVNVCSIKSYGHFNPSRAINHQREGLTILKTENKQQLVFGLDENDNIRPSEMDMATAQILQAKYIDDTCKAIDSELRKASEAVYGSEDYNSLKSCEFSLRCVETYVEIKTANAPDLLESITPTLKSYHKRTRVRTHGEKFEEGLDESLESNAQTVTLFLGNGISIKIYAKTNKRLRIEVTHKPHKQSNILEEGYVAKNSTQFKKKLHKLKGLAASQINDLLAYLREFRDGAPKDRAKASTYASRWFLLLGHSDASQRAYGMLCKNGRIVRGKSLNQDERDLIQRAKNKGLVLSRSGVIYPAKITEKLTIDNNGTKSTCLFRRKGSSIWNYRKRIPSDLLEAKVYDKKKEIKVSLKTEDEAIAHNLADTLTLKLKAEWKAKRLELKKLTLN